MNFIKNNALSAVALVIAVIALFLPQAPVVTETLGRIYDTSYFDYFDATTAYKLNGTTVIDSTGVVSGGAGSFTTGTFSSTVSTGLFTKGGGVLSTSTASTAMVPTAATFNYGLIQVTPNTADLTYTFPASSTMSAMIPNAGDSRSVMVYNATTTAGIDVIFAAGAGMEIKTVGTATGISMDESSFALLTFVRKANSDILVLMSTPVDD